MALLLITHDLGIVRKMADTVAVMSQGEIVEQGDVGPVFDAPPTPTRAVCWRLNPKASPTVRWRTPR